MEANKKVFKKWIERIEIEIDGARECFPAFHSSHEGYAVILEEVDELWDAIKSNSSTNVMSQEVVQIAAMSLCFLMELCEPQIEYGVNK